MNRVGWRLVIVLAFAGLVHSALSILQPADLSGDAARLGIHTWDLLQRGVWPFYIYHLFAPNPLITWLQAIAFSLGGPSVAALHAVTIVIGVLCAGLTYIVAVTLFRTDGLTVARRTGLLAGLSLPLLPVLNHFVYGGTEHLLLPFFALLTAAALWRGLQLGNRADFIVAGVALGVSQYGYIVARVLPVAVAAAALAILWRAPILRRRWRGLFIMTFTASLIALPQWILFATAPYTFLARSGQEAGRFIFAEPEALAVFTTKLWHQVLALGWQWESGYNPSGRGLLPGILYVAALAGVFSALRMRTPAILFLLTLSGVLMIPDALTVEGVWPSATRLIGAMPFWMLLAGYGAAQFWNWLETRGEWAARAAPLVLVIVLVAGIENQWHRTQVVLPRFNAQPGREWMSSLVELAEAEYILAQPNTAILIPSDEYQRAPLAFRLSEHFPERAGVPTAPLTAGETVTVVMPTDTLRPTTDGVPPRVISDEWVLLRGDTVYFLPPLANSLVLIGAPAPLYARNGALAAQVSEGRWRGVQPTPTATDIQFDNGMRVTAFAASALTPTEPLGVTLYWATDRTVTQDLQLFTQLLDHRDAVIAGVHDWPLRGVYRLNAWRIGERVPLNYSFPIPADLPPGEYRLITGVYDIVHQARVPLPSGGDDVAVVARFKVPLKVEAFDPTHTASAEFGGMIQLRGYTVTEAGVRLLWRATRPPDFNYTLFLHALDSAGNLVAQVDTQPLAGQYPTSIWDAGETVMMEAPLVLPPGVVSVRVGWYRWDTGERLPVAEAGQFFPEDSLPLQLAHSP